MLHSGGAAGKDQQEEHFESMRKLCFTLLLLLGLSGCVHRAELEQTQVSGGSAVPAGAKVEPSGFLTIEEVPPTPYPANPPPLPASIDSFSRRLAATDNAGRDRLWEEANGPAVFQAEVQRLLQVLPEQEPDNFVQLRLTRDEAAGGDPTPLIGAEVWFKRDAAATLARYTSDPLFIPREGGFTDAEMEARRRVWFDRLNGEPFHWTLSSDAISGSIAIEFGLTEERFRRLAAERGWTVDEAVRLTFAEPQPPAFADKALEPLVRAFTREESAPLIQLTALSTGRITLKDGCFRLAQDGEDLLVMFGHSAALDRDDEGYLVVRTGDDVYRIGEVGAWGGPNKVFEEEPAVRDLRRVCGRGEVINVRSPRSLRLFALPSATWLADYAGAKGLSYRAAWDEVIECYRREERRGRSGLELRGRCIRQFN